MSLKYITLVVIASLAVMSCNDQEEGSDAYGNFEATATTVSSEVGGKLILFDIEEGIIVDEGAMVGQVDTVQLHLQKKKVQATINTLPQKLRIAIDDIQVLQERKANLVRERDRAARLVERKAATQKQLDDLNGEIDVVERQIKALQTQTETANSAILSEKGPLIAQMEILNDQIRKSKIYNPIRGTVLTKLAEEYEMVSPGKPLYRIAPLDTVTFRFYVDAVQLQALSLGDKVEILIDSGIKGYESLDGRVSWIAEEAEFTPRMIQTKKDRVTLVYAVKARVQNTDGRLKIGMPGEVNFKK